MTTAMVRASRRPLFVVLAVGALAGTGLGCGSGHAATPQDHVFYQSNDVVAGPAVQSSEWAYPQLDAPSIPPLPAYDGVSLFYGGVHLSRPQTWTIRLAGGPPTRRYVEYVSPHAYLFSVYELSDSVGSWDDTLTEYENEATQAGAEFMSKRVPMAIANGQGLAYVVKRAVPGAKGPLVNYSHEYVLHGEHRIVLAQVVIHSPDIDVAASELRRVLETIEVP
jgi:hypothetical protein